MHSRNRTQITDEHNKNVAIVYRSPVLKDGRVIKTNDNVKNVEEFFVCPLKHGKGVRRGLFNEQPICKGYTNQSTIVAKIPVVGIIIVFPVRWWRSQ